MSRALISSSIAAATAVVGFNLLQNETNRYVAPGETVSFSGLKGSAAAGDTEVALKAGSLDIATLFNNNTGFPGRDDLMPVGWTNNTGQTVELYAIVVDAPATNPINLAVVKA